MPPSSAADPRVSTVIFRIPHLSNLIIFKNVLGQKGSLVALVAEMLKLGHPEILYLGYDYSHSPRKDVLANKGNAAIIRVCVPGKELIRRSVHRTISMFIEELQKRRNVISVASETLSPEKDIIAVAMTVESITHYNKYHAVGAQPGR